MRKEYQVINPSKPDYKNTPANTHRATYHYQPKEDMPPVISIITPYYNTGPIFEETCRSIFRQSYCYWEWIIVDDGSTNETSLKQLDRLQEIEPRVTVLHVPNRGPGIARNIAAKAARGKYLLQLDSDDLIEPTFMEKTLWFLETAPQFAACNTYSIGFGVKEYLWPTGFQTYERNCYENMVTNQTLIRKEQFREVGGYDETLLAGHEDWDFWLNFAEAGYWGYTLHDFLTWYRVQHKSRMSETEKDKGRAEQFRQWLKKKHNGLSDHFPKPARINSVDTPHADVALEASVTNPLIKPVGIKRILLIVTWFETGGADKFNLDMIATLSKRGYEFTVVSTLDSENPWLSEFCKITPDVFYLHSFINRCDFPRFVSYLIESRDIDNVIITNSELGYLLTPFIRWKYPTVPIIDYNHAETEDWINGGYPKMAIRAGDLIDLNVTCTDHLRNWMIKHGAPSDRVKVVHANIDTKDWDPTKYEREALRQKFLIPKDTPVILFIARMVEEKRPLIFGEAIRQLATANKKFLAIVIGNGPELDKLQSFVDKHQLSSNIRFAGTLPNEEVRKYMAAGDILMLPSQREGLALVLYECMAMELIPVAADVGGHAELVTPETGYLVAHGPDEVQEYVTILQKLIENPQLRAQIAHRARERVTKQFDLQNMADGMEQAFAEAKQRLTIKGPNIIDKNVVEIATHQAIEYVRVSQVADMLWGERSQKSTLKDRFRDSFMPYGTKRYAIYKKIRLLVRKNK
jgi:glycosyltransferase involved in cell wall biosynthesis